MKYIEEYKWLLSIIALVGIEIAPIKISPFTWLGKIVGKLLGINKVEEEIENVKTNLNELRNEVDDNEIDRIRQEILQFSWTLRRGLERTEVDYIHIEEIYTKYKNKGGNSYIRHEMDFIRECHDKHLIK